jgi:hypothetical protein
MPASAAPIQSELSLQFQVAGLLEKNLAPPAIYTAFPAGGGGDMRGKILRSAGLKSGFPDIWIMWGGPAPERPFMDARQAGFGLYMMELKTLKGRLSDAQREIHAAIHLTLPGAKIAVIRTLDECREQLQRWGLPRRGVTKDQMRLLGQMPHAGRRRPFDDPMPV